MPKSTADPIHPENFTTFGELLRFLRERAELSQRELALQVGYHYSYMSRIENNDRMPDSATLMARFVPALGLEDEPQWTERLLKLAASEKKTITPRKNGQGASRSSTPASALPTFSSPQASLPLSLTPLLGREKEIESLTQLMSRADVRLVTLVGPPGVGKTRLAIQTANVLSGMFAHGAVFTDLSTIREAKNVLAALAETLGLPLVQSDAPLITQLINTLQPKNLLLVIDNFEHVIEAAPQLVQLLGNAPQIKAVITSREALRISGEHEFTVETLAVPKPGQNKSDQLLDHAAIQLFAQRAQATDPDFKLTIENLTTISEICRRLDGLPLAVELAAARIKFLSPEAMLSQFDRHLDWAAHGPRDITSSRQTLRGAIEWSYDTLSDAERALMRRLSVFSGGWNAILAESVCGEEEAGSNPLLRRNEILNTLIQLTDKSLVIIEKRDQETRFRFLETIQEFAREKLENAGEMEKFKNRHLAHFAEFAETMEANIDGSNQLTWIRSGDSEIENIRAALDWGLNENAVFNDALRLITSVSLYWIIRSYYHEGFERASTYLSQNREAADDLLRTKLLYRSGAMAGYTSDLITGWKLCEEAVASARTQNNNRNLANALFYFSDIAHKFGQKREARLALEECISLCWQENYATQLSVSLTNLGILQNEEDDSSGAISTLEEALGIASQAEDIIGTAHALHSLGKIHFQNQMYDKAITYMKRSLDVNMKIGNRRGQAATLADLSILYYLNQDIDKSEDHAKRAFGIFKDTSDEFHQSLPLRMMGYAAVHAGNLVHARALVLESLAACFSQQDIAGQLAGLICLANCSMVDKDHEEALTLCTLVEEQSQGRGIQILEPEKTVLDALFIQCKKKLSKAEYKEALQRGQVLNLEDTVLKIMA